MFIVSEEELKEFYLLAYHDGVSEDNLSIGRTSDFLKSKQPVELVAEFKPNFYFENIQIDCHEHIGQHIKIYISKGSEGKK